MYCEYVPVFVLLRCTKSAAKIDTYFFQGCRSRGAINGRSVDLAELIVNPVSFVASLQSTPYDYVTH